MPERQPSKANIFSDTVELAITTLRMPIRQLSKRKVDTNHDSEGVEAEGASSAAPS
jgi:hypothetical protein